MRQYRTDTWSLQRYALDWESFICSHTRNTEVNLGNLARVYGENTFTMVLSLHFDTLWSWFCHVKKRPVFYLVLYRWKEKQMSIVFRRKLSLSGIQWWGCMRLAHSGQCKTLHLPHKSIQSCGPPEPCADSMGIACWGSRIIFKHYLMVLSVLLKKMTSKWEEEFLFFFSLSKAVHIWRLWPDHQDLMQQSEPCGIKFYFSADCFGHNTRVLEGPREVTSSIMPIQ